MSWSTVTEQQPRFIFQNMRALMLDSFLQKAKTVFIYGVEKVHKLYYSTIYAIDT
jgi:hypothetical protein